MVRFDSVKDKVTHYSRLPLEFKKANLTYCELIDLPYGQMTENEQLLKEVVTDEVIGQVPLFYDNERLISADGLSESGRGIIFPIIKMLFRELGVGFVFEKISLEIRFRK